MPYLIHKNKFSSISFNAIIIIYKIALQLINGKKIFYSFIKIHFITFQTCNFKNGYFNTLKRDQNDDFNKLQLLNNAMK